MYDIRMGASLLQLSDSEILHEVAPESYLALTIDDLSYTQMITCYNTWNYVKLNEGHIVDHVSMDWETITKVQSLNIASILNTDYETVVSLATSDEIRISLAENGIYFVIPIFNEHAHMVFEMAYLVSDNGTNYIDMQYEVTLGDDKYLIVKIPPPVGVLDIIQRTIDGLYERYNSDITTVLS